MEQQLRRLEKVPGSLTVVELLIGIVVIGILLAIALPAYFGLRESSWDGQAHANLAEALPAVEEYAASAGGYSGMTAAALQRLDPGVARVSVPTASRTAYCIESTVRRRTWRIEGPGSTAPVPGECSRASS